jgi:hypothetical protein
VSSAGFTLRVGYEGLSLSPGLGWLPVPETDKGLDWTLNWAGLDSLTSWVCGPMGLNLSSPQLPTSSSSSFYPAFLFSLHGWFVTLLLVSVWGCVLLFMIFTNQHRSLTCIMWLLVLYYKKLYWSWLIWGKHVNYLWIISWSAFIFFSVSMYSWDTFWIGSLSSLCLKKDRTCIWDMVVLALDSIVDLSSIEMG